MKQIAFALMAVLLLASCGGEKEPGELFEEQQSGVCMVLNSYYYEIELPTGKKWYCSGIDEDGDLAGLTLDESEVQKDRAMSTGTAFFIDQQGTLLTNRHVVSPMVSEAVIKKATIHLLSAIKDYMHTMRGEYAMQYQQLEQEKQNCYYTDFYGNYIVDNNKLNDIVQQQQQLSDNFDEATSAEEQIGRLDYSELQVRPVCEVGIAYNNTYVTSKNDFLGKNQCVVVKVSDDENVDLATIQLKDKVTPKGKYVFKVNGIDSNGQSITDKLLAMFGNDNDGALKIGQELVMIGFNAGLVLGTTKQGVQAQMTTGQVTQAPDGQRLLYSIPTMQGSSGSPVVDREGHVRAVNFAKLRGTDNFNFGIPENKIKKFLEN